MRTFHAEAVVTSEGKILLEQVPFSEGESVHVVVSSSSPGEQRPLKGSVLRFERPMESIVTEDWETDK